MIFITTYILKMALPMAIATQSCCHPGDFNEASFESLCNQRLNSAQKLTREATDLIDRNRALKSQIKICQAITGVTDYKFSSTVDDYQTARKQYLMHRQEYDLHVKEFHRQAKSDSRPLPPLAVPDVKPIASAVEDACAQLQALEQQLKQSETELCQMIQILQAEKGKVPEQAYFQKWLNTQSMAMSVQNGALQFNRGVTTKCEASADRIHSASEAANVSGDFVQNKKVYAFVQQSTALENEETRRAQLHSTLASQCFIYINALNPNSTSDDGSTTITADQLVKESSDLQTEYNALQSKYSSVKEAKPPHN